MIWEAYIWIEHFKPEIYDGGEIVEDRVSDGDIDNDRYDDDGYIDDGINDHDIGDR